VCASQPCGALPLASRGNRLVSAWLRMPPPLISASLVCVCASPPHSATHHPSLPVSEWLCTRPLPSAFSLVCVCRPVAWRGAPLLLPVALCVDLLARTVPLSATWGVAPVLSSREWGCTCRRFSSLFACVCARANGVFRLAYRIILRVVHVTTSHLSSLARSCASPAHGTLHRRGCVYHRSSSLFAHVCVPLARCTCSCVCECVAVHVTTPHLLRSCMRVLCLCVFAVRPHGALHLSPRRMCAHVRMSPLFVFACVCVALRLLGVAPVLSVCGCVAAHVTSPPSLAGQACALAGQLAASCMCVCGVCLLSACACSMCVFAHGVQCRPVCAVCACCAHGSVVVPFARRVVSW